MRVLLPFALMLATSAVGCGGGEDGGVPPPEPRFSDIQAKVFSPSCAAFSSCHSSVGLAAKCDLTAAKAYGELVDRASPNVAGRTLVVPGHPEESFLIAKLRGELGAGEGDRMPLRNPQLPESTIEAIEAWIASGAAND